MSLLDQYNEKLLQEYRENYYKELEKRLTLERKIEELQTEIIRLKYSVKFTADYCKSVNFCRGAL